MRIVGDEAKLNFVERWIVGGPRRQAIGAVACAAAMERLDGRQQALAGQRATTNQGNMLLDLERAAVGVVQDHVADMASRLLFHTTLRELGVPAETAREHTYPIPR